MASPQAFPTVLPVDLPVELPPEPPRPATMWKTSEKDTLLLAGLGLAAAVAGFFALRQGGGATTCPIQPRVLVKGPDGTLYVITDQCTKRPVSDAAAKACNYAVA